ncbi:mechanosensitive ion channel domain-containing protein [Caenispirillum salinarum]|uniref:mechanosensitive ion channel domain-containing protein n=1 Tax=Caenispirillum salinarum TaxID=859058 RepID=UPI00384E0F3D
MSAPLDRAQQAQAQEADAAAPADVSEQTVRDLEALVATLEDEAQRQELVTRLKALIEATRPAEEGPGVVSSIGARLLGDVSDAMGTATREMVDLGRAAETLPDLWDWGVARITEPELRGAAVRGVLRVAALVVAALAAFWIVRRLLAKPRNRLHGRQREPKWYERIFITLGLLLMRAAPVGALLATGYGVMPALDLAPGSRVVALVILTAIAAVQGIMIASDLLLQPSNRSLRWLALGDEAALYLHIWTRRLALVGVIGFFGAEAALTFGLPDGAYQLVTRLVGFVMALLIIIVIMQSKQPVAAWIRERRMVVHEAPLEEGDGETTQGDRGGDVPAARPLSGPDQPVAADDADPATPGLAGDAAATRDAAAARASERQARRRPKRRKPLRPGGAIGRVLRDRFADVWHVLAALYVLASYAVWALEVEGGFQYILRGTVLTVVIVLLATGLVTLLSAGLARLFEVSQDVKDRFPDIERRVNRYLPVVHTAVRVLVFLLAAGAIAQAWGVAVVEALTTDAGGAFIGALVTILLVLVVSVVVWELASSSIERYLSTTDKEGNVIERSARAKTLLPLARNILLVVMIVVVSMVILSELGVNIAPLIAGAGVIGLAVGFGAQKLVQDVITGAFILFENTFSVGDVVSVGGHAGLVEGMTVRSVRLRDLAGTVHTLPFSSVDKISNLTKDFSYYVIDMGVAYREDTDEVVEVCKEVVEDLRADPEYGPQILEPLEVLGVDKFADSAVIVKTRIKTKPIQQWFVGREFNRRLKKRFDELGIEIPFPHRTLYFGEGKDGTAPPAHVLMDRFRGGHGGGETPHPAEPPPPTPSPVPDPEPT